ncbi:uncharacterized protein IL334_005415 [Kwoniella shivajii]|uniref:Solute carrier family 39 (Zinc transporter), member 9 n=1 Tax=Kwoniella shivajii TaxID=564305 RepID=A0ABZ1D340_9TREE|nr:hypothetical protein IL334_005415 [Kwoniella shivajii]
MDSPRRPTPQHLNSHTPLNGKPKKMHVHDHDESQGVSGSVHGLNATLGMVIHGAADGIALGASSLSGNGSLSLIIFLAVLVHKGPTALGLTTTLLSLNLTHTAIRRRLIIFSFAAPVGAILTFLVGGSFLYVATVIQPLSSHQHDHHTHVESGDPNGQQAQENLLGKYERTLLLVLGMGLPAMLSWAVGDEH